MNLRLATVNAFDLYKDPDDPSSQQRGALRNAHGQPEDRWPLLAARIDGADPDAVLNEVRRWDDDHRQPARDMGRWVEYGPGSEPGPGIRAAAGLLVVLVATTALTAAGQKDTSAQATGEAGPQLRRLAVSALRSQRAGSEPTGRYEFVHTGSGSTRSTLSPASRTVRSGGTAKGQ